MTHSEVWRWPLALWIFSGSLRLAFAAARRLLGANASASLTTAGAFTLFYWSQCLIFNLLVALHIFGVPSTLVIGIMTGSLGWWAGHHGHDELRQILARWWPDRARVRQDPLLVVSGVMVGAHAALRLIRGMATPPLAWDTLTYHLPRVVRWIQFGYDPVLPGPGAWGYYEHFPRLSEITWGWGFAVVGSDAALAPVGMLHWIALLVGVAALATQFGASPSGAFAAALAGASIPAMINTASSGYVDVFSAATLSLGLALLWSLRANWSPGAVALGVGALTLHAGTKLTGGISLVAAPILVLTALPIRRWRELLPIGLGVSLLVIATLLPTVVRTWMATGSPIYPMEFSVAGVTFFHGDPELLATLRNRLPGHSPDGSAMRLLLSLLSVRADPGCDLVALTPTSLLLVSAGALAVWRRRREGGGLVVVIALISLPLLGACVSGEAAAIRTFWSSVSARLFCGLPIVCAALVSALPGRFVPIALSLVAISQVVMGFPSVHAPVIVEVMLVQAPAWAGALCLLVVGVTLSRRWHLVLPASIVLAGAWSGWLAGPPRERARHSIWRAVVGERPAMEIHPIAEAYRAGLLLWASFDTRRSFHIGYSKGWSSASVHYLFRYPLYGRRWQNTVEFVPVTLDGSMLNMMDPREASRTDPRAWRRAILSHRINYILLHWPTPLELSWVESMPDLFERKTPSNGSYMLYRVSSRR